MPSPNSEQHRSTRQKVTEWLVPRRAVLKTGALGSGALALGDATGRAAARRGGKGGFSARTPVIDSEDPDPDAAIVLTVLDAPISDWIVYGNETVADQNPAYDPEDRVVIVAFEYRLDSGWSNWRQAKPDSLFDGVVARGIKFHAFPQTRLERPHASGAGAFPVRAPVVDSEDPEPETAIVINDLDVPIGDWIVYGNETVADQNPAYDPEDRVVIVAFEHLLDQGWPEWRQAEPESLFSGVVSRGIKFHAFPQTRLEKSQSNGA